jgi:hypothetical protein
MKVIVCRRSLYGAVCGPHPVKTLDMLKQDFIVNEKTHKAIEQGLVEKSCVSVMINLETKVVDYCYSQ